MILKDFNKRKQKIKAHVEAGYLEEAIESCSESIEELLFLDR
jgi:hypothetical protein